MADFCLKGKKIVSTIKKVRGPFTNQPLYVICGLALWNVPELQYAFEGFELTEDPPFTSNTHRLPEVIQVWQQTQFVPVTFNKFYYLTKVIPEPLLCHIRNAIPPPVRLQFTS